MKKAIIVLRLPVTSLVKFENFVAVNSVWTMFSIPVESGFFGPNLTDMHICATGTDDEELERNISLIKSTFPNELKTIRPL